MVARRTCLALAFLAWGACGGDDGGSKDTGAADTTSDTSASEVGPDTTDTGAPGDGDDVDTSCPEGTLGCACDGDGACEDGLACHDDDRCHACDTDTAGCPCTLDPGCGSFLVCDDADPGDTLDLRCRPERTCADVACADHQICGEGDVEEDAACVAACESGYTWDGAACQPNPAAHCGTSANDPDAIGDDCAAANKACVPADGLEPARCGDCLAGYLADAGQTACREPIACAAIAATCDAQHRLCIAATVSPAADARCGVCQAPWAEPDAGAADPETCVVDAAADCAPDGDNTLYAVCAALSRECVDPDDGAPACGDCAAPYFEDPATGLCDLPSTCADLGCEALGRACTDDGFATCEDCEEGLAAIDPSDPTSACVETLTCRNLDCGDAFCVESETPGVDATCVTSTCSSGQALDTSDDSCVTCSGVCNKSGQTGRFWLYTKTNGTCVCETLADWYVDTTLGATPKPCDADGDGWVRSSAEPFVDPSGTPDAAITANARCDVRTIDRVTLQNEYGQRYEVRLCSGGPVAEGASCASPTSVSLYEATELDDDVSLSDVVKYPVYARGASGRRLRAEEVSPLTKACISDGADLNGNAIEDLVEAAEMDVPSGVSLSTEQAELLHFGYFVELHTSWYEDRPGEEHGTVVIAERSRCDEGTSGDAFVLGYAEAGIASDYWRSCGRNRRAGFDRGDPRPGFDLARWMCDATRGVCPMPEPPTLAEPDDQPPAHGLCEVLLPPADGVWRGMNHHSQFRCVEVTSDADADEAWELGQSALYDKITATGGAWQFNDCGVTCPDEDAACDADCPDDGACDTSSDAVRGDANPHSPVLGCAASLPSVGAVGFVARRYDDERSMDDYQEGCIDEWKVWPTLCPGWVDDLAAGEVQSTIGDGQGNAFGELVCGCGAQYGGLSCDVGCPEVMVDEAYAVSPRSGWWLCGEVAATAMVELDADEGPAFTGEDEDGQGFWVLDGAIEVVPRERKPLCQDSGDCDAGWRLR